MCTVVTLRRPGHDWPLLLAANRDEMLGRAWSPPARHWPDRPTVRAGLDHEAGGSWLGVNDAGVAVAILNRRGSLGAAEGKRSRGELVLRALGAASARAAMEDIAAVDAGAYRSFNMMVADARDGFWLKGVGAGAVEAAALPEGIGILTAWDLNDTGLSARTAFYLPRFRAARPPAPEAGDWREWQGLLESTETARGVHDPNGAMTVETDWGFGTVSRALVALPRAGEPVWLFAGLHPEPTGYVPVAG
ncbi:MAG: NRDE family protein [Alphaproteobacteria bacterium]|nr:NRDE family protein [Alphaproteobacteria bacterium]MCB9931232.1 NRDE family protein [Alphaproteobacteria bacterium]